MLLQLLTSWKNALTPNLLRVSKDAPGADGARGANRDTQVARKTEHVLVSGGFYTKIFPSFHILQNFKLFTFISIIFCSFMYIVLVR
jgi:hypothetical protein